MCGLFGMGQPIFADEPKIAEAFRTGRGVGWDEHDARLYGSTDRIFRNGYAAHLVSDWIPALDGVESKLRTGAMVADVGCGYGSSTILMAKAYPDVAFRRLRLSRAVDRGGARSGERSAGVDDRVRFEVASAKAMPETRLSIWSAASIACTTWAIRSECSRARAALKPNGTLMIVEPFAGDALEENLTPVGRIFYAASTMLCTPSSLAQEVRAGTGGAGGRSADARGRPRGGVRALPARGRDAVQHRLRGPAVRGGCRGRPGL